MYMYVLFQCAAGSPDDDAEGSGAVSTCIA